MPHSRQDRFAHPELSTRCCLVGAALLSAVLPVIGSAHAWADESIVLDFVRHGQSTANVGGLFDKGTLNTVVPGPELTQLGEEQAEAVAKVLAPGAPYAGIYESAMIRTQETAQPLLDMLHASLQILPGLDEIDDGIFEGQPTISLAGLLYVLPQISWIFGLDFVPILGSTDPNGIAFDERYSDAIQTIYNNDFDVSNPVVSPDGKITDVVFSHDAAISVWTLMNVNNPDPLLYVTDMLPNTGQAVVQGSPEEGWTLVSWNGTPIGPASLPTELFVDFRDVIVAPQLAGYNIGQAIATGDPTTIVSAIRTGAYDVGAATLNFPVAVARDIVDAVRDALPGSLSLGDVPASLAGLPGDVSAMVGSLVDPALASI
ncbi:histidine phosphatase family protein [Mycobacterium sp.]|uniref:histidine phosphatase family protein n=1 Tax=Mycobacterium sp. TaxID=1785 RepID=UPI0031CEE14E